IDVAAMIVADIDDEALTVEDRVEVAGPLIYVVGPHGAEVEVTDGAVRLAARLQPSGVLPLVVAQVRILLRRDRGHENFARVTLDGPHLEKDLHVGFAEQQSPEVGDAEGGHAINRRDDLAVLNQRLGAGEGWCLVGQIRVMEIDVLYDVAARLFIATKTCA